MTKRQKAFMPILAMLLLCIINSKYAKADEEALYKPTLAWEAKELHQELYGLQFINDEKQIIYYADGYIIIRDVETGEIINKSKKFNWHPDSSNREAIIEFYQSTDKTELYGLLFWSNSYLYKLL